MGIGDNNSLKSKREIVGFTLLELVIVLTIIGIVSSLIIVRTNLYRGWKEGAVLRELIETIYFLHHAAVMDQAFYRIEFDFAKNGYKVGVLKAVVEDNTELSDLAATVGNVSLELAAFLSPGIGKTAVFIPPPNIPSLGGFKYFPETLSIIDVQTMRGKETEGKPYLLFSPRGFSEFGVIHLRTSDGEKTILINPFTGEPKKIDGYKDFKWTYGRRREEG